MSHKIKFPILTPLNKEFKVKRNYLRDKYPNVDFKDEDIDKYDYQSHDKHVYILSEFLKQYNVKTLGIKYLNWDSIHYMTNPKVNGPTHEHALNNNSINIEYDDLFEGSNEHILLKRCYDKKYTKSYFELDVNIDNDKEFEFSINPLFKIDIEAKLNDNINKDNFISFYMDKILSFINPEEVIYKHPNGYMYYTKNYCLVKTIMVNNSKDVGWGQNKKTFSEYEFRLQKYSTVQEYKKYINNQYGDVKTMHKKAKQISFEQLKIELISICNNVYNKAEYVKSYYNNNVIKNMFKNENVLFIFDKFNETVFTNYKDKNKNTDAYIETTKIYKKDKLIGEYKNFNEVNETIKNEILEFLLKKFGDDLALNVIDDIDFFVSELNLSIYENQEYTGDYFLYNESFDLGKYKIQINSGEYIKDQSVCPLDIHGFVLYKVK